MELKQVEEWYNFESARNNRMLVIGPIFFIVGILCTIFLGSSNDFVRGFLEFFLILGGIVFFTAFVMRKPFQDIFLDIKEFYKTNSEVDLTSLKNQLQEERINLKFALLIIISSIIVAIMLYLYVLDSPYFRGQSVGVVAAFMWAGLESWFRVKRMNKLFVDEA